jgi:broad specificity phosphatase PhoE/predicted kinase
VRKVKAWGFVRKSDPEGRGKRMAHPLVIAMVGLPARGKSTMARKIAHAFAMDGVETRIFNNGELRRQLTGPETSLPEFFSPRNEHGLRLRDQFARLNVQRAKEFLARGGQMAVLDAANITRERREWIQRSFSHGPVLFMECVNFDEEVLETNLQRKTSLEEFSGFSPEVALEGFRKRISYYEDIYEPMEHERNRVVVHSFEGRVLQEEFQDPIPHYDRLRDLIVTRLVKNLFLVRHGETFFNLEDRIGGDSELTPRGWTQAETLADHFATHRIPLIFTSGLQRARQTAVPISRRQEQSTIIPLGEFDEIHSGICEEMSYGEIRERYPEVSKAREKDKYGYQYPGGESYATMEQRVERGIRKVFYLSEPEDNIMIVGHRGVNRMILSNFVTRRKEEVPYIYMPQNSYYHIVITPYKKLLELKPY